MTGRVCTVLLLGLCVAVSAAPAVAERAVRVYEVRHRAPGDLVESARAVLEPVGGRVVVDGSGSAMVLVGERRAVEETVALLARLDVPQRTVVLRHETRSSAELRSEGLGVDWLARGGGLRVGNVLRPHHGHRHGHAQPHGRSGSIRRHGDDPSLSIRIEPDVRRSRRSTHATGTVSVLEGRTARIATGTTVPVRVRGPWVDHTALLSAETGIEVRPVLLGDGRIRLDVWAFAGDIDEGLLAQDEVVATIEVEEGESVAIAGFEREEESRDADLGGIGRSRSSEESVLLVSARVEPPRVR